MTLLELVTYLRINILDDSGGYGADWTTFLENTPESYQLRWTNEELTANINEAINQVYRRILPVKESSATFDITLVAGTQDYVLDPRILQVIDIRLASNGKALKRNAIEELWCNRNLFTDEGEPEFYVPNYETGSISLYRTPDSIDTLNLLVYRLPLTPLDWSSNGAVAELREEFSIPMLWYAAHLCYDKDEANVEDPNRSLYFLQKFNQEFIQTTAYSDTRKRRTSNRSIVYGGY